MQKVIVHYEYYEKQNVIRTREKISDMVRILRNTIKPPLMCCAVYQFLKTN